MMTRFSRPVCIGILFLLLTLGIGAASHPQPAPTDPSDFVDTVRTESGRLAGVPGSVPSVTVYRGIPYAAPPVGELRWRAPRPPRSWEGVRSAARFGPVCMQPDQQPGSFYQREFYQQLQPMSEDCLYLNVWTGAGGTGGASSDDLRAVMVWIHGGAFVEGSGSLPSFDGAELARKGVVVVTINYRLGPFGLMTHPALSAESPKGASGNYGLLDQIAALEWVEENIEAFGGDPDRVTVFGQSAGGSSIHQLMASPLAEGTFERAIVQSGSGYAFGDPPPLAEQEENGERLADSLGAASVAELRTAHPDSVMAASRGVSFSTVVDGRVLERPVSEVFEAGDQMSVPVLTGWTADEATTLTSPETDPSAYEEQVRERLGERADRYFSFYPPGDTPEQAGASMQSALTDRIGWGAHTLARVHTATSGQPAYLYHFAHAPPGRDRDRYGAYHSSELVYVFDALEAVDRPWQPADRRLADLISWSWVRFAQQGSPTSNLLSAWPVYEEIGDPVLVLADEIQARTVLGPEKIRFLDEVRR